MVNRIKYSSIFLLLALALVLRLIAITQSLWLDESTTALVAQRSIQDYFSNFAPGDFHPPLYYLLSIIVANVVGSSELALRSVSVVAGIATVYFAFRISEFISKSKTVGLLAGLFMATSGLHIYYSQEARMYVLAALFATMSVYYYLKENWKAFGVSIAAMILTHYVTVFLLPIFWFHGYVSRKDKIWWKKFGVSHLYLIVGFGLWFPIFNKQLTAGLGVESSTPLWWNILGKTTPKELILVPAKFLFGRITIDNNLIYLLVTAGVSIWYSVIIVRRPLKDRPLKRVVGSHEMIIWLWLLVPAFLTGLMGLWIPVFSYFRILFVLPSLYVLLSLGVGKLSPKMKLIAVVSILMVNLVSSSIYLFNPRFHREDWKGLVDFVSKEREIDDAVLFVSNSQMEAYNYYYEKRLEDVNGCTLSTSQCNDPVAAGDPEFSELGKTIWLMRYVQPIFDPEDLVRGRVERLGYEKTSEYDFNGIVVWRYEK